ncbi:MAG: hypothetical protein CME36_19635 [unclassified Hahellaceae]|nr:hypothetical protein [Hahellaceae bacterium]
MRDKSKLFPSMQAADQVMSARVWHCSYESLSALSECVNLEVLVIATLPNDSFEFLAKCKALRYLSVLHLPQVSDLHGLACLSNLQVLSLATSPGWDSSGRIQEVRSLSPLAHLSNLKNIELLGVCPPSRSPDELLQCPRLESARFSKYNKQLVTHFHQHTEVKDEFAPEPPIPN